LIKDEHKRATSVQKHRSVGFDNCAFAAQQGVLQHIPPDCGHERTSRIGGFEQTLLLIHGLP
jgi:hypothetical protein